MYNMKIYFTMPYRANNIKTANLNPCEIAYFLKFANIFTRENVYIHSNSNIFIIATDFLRLDL